MHLATITTASSAAPRLAAQTQSHFVDLAAAAASYPTAGLDEHICADMRSFLAAGRPARQAGAELLATVQQEHVAGRLRQPTAGPAILIELEQAQRHAPLQPRRLRDYLTYPGHAAGAGLDVPEALAAMPICYQGNVEQILGPDETIPWPAYTRQLDYELELAIVTGGPVARDLSPRQASEHIAGYTLFNDVSARDIQAWEMQLGIGPSKGKNFANILGPVVLTPDEVDEDAIELTARVNGDTWSHGSTSGRQHSCADVLAWASYGEDLHPGEVLAIGTPPGGCGAELDRWLQPGDTVELEASGIGTLRNTVGQPATPNGAGVPSYQGAPTFHVPSTRS